MELKTKLYLAIAHFLLVLPTTTWSMDIEEIDSDSIIPGKSEITGRVYNVVPSVGRPSYERVLSLATPHHAHLKLGDHTALPDSIQFSDKIHYIHNQEQLGSCTGESLTQSMEMQLIESQYRPLSVLFVYWNERNVEGTVNEDSGASLSDGIEVVNKYGACADALWPYTNYKTTYTEKPTPECYQDALKSVVLTYSHVPHTLDDLKGVLAQKIPVVSGIVVKESFESESATKTGIIPMPKRFEKTLGGHAITLVGYDDAKQLITFCNSWGADWGDKGLGYLPYDYFSNPKLTMPTEIWSINSVGPQTPPSSYGSWMSRLPSWSGFANLYHYYFPPKESSTDTPS
ncbi:MAG TPA: C1 family peptidase [Candidatus Nitrosotenuis sp.]|jgi:C1A family cysteine protease|nr:C1 family peptidase [Candidatus Nitrosotenuis sp.]